ncbi:hypothetical protein C8A00DRAFT_29571 [Chaetomidium leptoderma]|uniref:Uncharacterized protein n=1 Tax=Chaetomidium leptoderma TaxID=669021 RepID=A0AAN7A133_9PEZI|nr:hypothetical protein C8A00DRAFT_29571 [Chaetomidium leptoderma]
MGILWVTSYGPPKNKHAAYDHWLLTGPSYLDINSLEVGYNAHMMIMHDSSSWLRTGVVAVKRWAHNVVS